MAQLPSGSNKIVAAPETEPERDIAAPRFSEARRAEIRAAHRAGLRWRLTSRWLGLVIFVVGALLLAFVFKKAYDGFNLYSDPGRLQSQFNMAGDGWEAKLQTIAAVLGAQVLQVAYLLILGFLASAIAARGIQFFAASEAIIDEAVVPDE